MERNHLPLCFNRIDVQNLSKADSVQLTHTCMSNGSTGCKWLQIGQVNMAYVKAIIDKINWQLSNSIIDYDASKTILTEHIFICI